MVIRMVQPLVALALVLGLGILQASPASVVCGQWLKS